MEPLQRTTISTQGLGESMKQLALSVILLTAAAAPGTAQDDNADGPHDPPVVPHSPAADPRPRDAATPASDQQRETVIAVLRLPRPEEEAGLHALDESRLDAAGLEQPAELAITMVLTDRRLALSDRERLIRYVARKGSAAVALLEQAFVHAQHAASLGIDDDLPSGVAESRLDSARSFLQKAVLEGLRNATGPDARALIALAAAAPDASVAERARGLLE